jgi:hypothetical protein
MDYHMSIDPYQTEMAIGPQCTRDSAPGADGTAVVPAEHEELLVAVHRCQGGRAEPFGHLKTWLKG